ncbi:MAG: hypothetical protein B6241_03850 [Spirochaetaceae bacterium 4572_59]|nr:MAG: hypothetical protein B6241_03850 [Spirochaetaceae bacterium 4572_59]
MKRAVLSFCLILTGILCSAESWETALAGILTSPPAQGLDGRIYCTSEDRAVHSLDSVSGKEYWSYRPGRKLKGFTTVSPDGTIFTLTNQNHILAISPGGWELWRFKMDSPPEFPPAIDSHGILYVLTEDKELFSIDRLGHAVSLGKMEKSYTGIYVYNNFILLQSPEELDFRTISGEDSGSIDLQSIRIVLSDKGLWCESDKGLWFRVDPKHNRAVLSDSPLETPAIYPKKEVLITDNLRIVSGRNDWFMEAYNLGAEAYNPLYQMGCNPSRTNGVRKIPLYSERMAGIVLKSLRYLLLNHQYFSSVIGEFEKIDNIQKLLVEHPDYDLQIMDLISSSEVRTSPGSESPSKIDSYSLFRLYMLLSKWGSIQSRDALIWLCSVEEDSGNLALIYRGLGNIGYDPDGRSLTALFASLKKSRHSEILMQAALLSALHMARYNGGQSMHDFFEILQFVSSRAQSKRSLKLIDTIIKELKE